MGKLPVISGGKCIKTLEKLGYYIARMKGDHVRPRCPNKNPITVPKHKELDPGTLRRIIREAEIPVDEFLRRLKD